jgi:hypothetical protein
MKSLNSVTLFSVWGDIYNYITMHGAKHSVTRLVAAVHNHLPLEPKNEGRFSGSVRE